MDGAHCFKLQIYEASPGDKHDYKLAMHSQINYSHHEKNHGSAYRSGSIFFNREGCVCQLDMFSRSNKYWSEVNFGDDHLRTAKGPVQFWYDERVRPIWDVLYEDRACPDTGRHIDNRRLDDVVRALDLF